MRHVAPPVIRPIKVELLLSALASHRFFNEVARNDHSTIPFAQFFSKPELENGIAPAVLLSRVGQRVPGSIDHGQTCDLRARMLVEDTLVTEGRTPV